MTSFPGCQSHWPYEEPGTPHSGHPAALTWNQTPINSTQRDQALPGPGTQGAPCSPPHPQARLPRALCPPRAPPPKAQLRPRPRPPRRHGNGQASAPALTARAAHDSRGSMCGGQRHNQARSSTARPSLARHGPRGKGTGLRSPQGPSPAWARPSWGPRAAVRWAPGPLRMRPRRAWRGAATAPR